MDYVFEMKDGSRFVLYASGNLINLLILGGGRRQRQLRVANDFLNSLTACKMDDEIYMAYISNSQEIVVEKLIANEKIILLRDTNDNMNIRNLSLNIIFGKIYLMCMINKDGQKAVVRCYRLCGEKKSDDISEDKEMKSYGIFDTAGPKVFCITDEAGESEYYEMDDDGEGFTLKKLIIDLEENVTKIIDSQHNITEKIIENMKLEYSEKLKSELDRQKAIFMSRYNKLAGAVKEIQQEGKRWRELYYENVKK